ncbi:outer membrane protein assembly factor [Luteitalea sp. TBR-22]|uniref:BamA/OMP85 family outer membrane protein n=1 Tax=Luteitalea sp. TBR-22 TaxID=2802971 RepID=UPI001EF5EC82|nr:BamA/TamA family outer membrane protein [Luteitalea sp. TBR-22]
MTGRALRRGLRACCLAWLVACGPASAQEEGASEVRLKVRSFDIHGVSGLDVKQITSVLATRESGGLIPFLGKDRYFSARQLQADLYRIIAFLSDQGWPQARVTRVDIDKDVKARAVDLRVQVEQGPPVIIDSVQTFGFEVLAPRDQEAVRSRVSLAAGQRRVQGDVRNTRNATLAVLQERGYAYASVNVLEGEGTQPGHVSLYVIAEPGPVSTFGRITVRGNDGVSDGRVKSLLSMKEGQQFRISRVVDSQRRLYNREIFQFVSVNAEPNGTIGAPVPVEVVLTQAKPRRLSLTPGYGSEEKARITTTLRHLNFFGGARTAQATLRWSSLDRGVRANVEEPSLFRRGISMSVGAQYWYANEPAYELTTKGGRVTFAKQRERSDPVRRKQSLTTLSVTFVDEFEDYTVSEQALEDPAFYDDLIALGLNPNTGRAKGQLIALAVDLNRNTTPNLIDARSGYLLQAHVEQAGQWLPGDYNYREYTVEARKYHTFGPLVLAGRARVGTIEADGVLARNVPFFKRYFLGGSASLRGWGRFEIAPLTFSGNPIGGHSMFESSGELRVPAFGQLSVVAFVDAGNVWYESFDINLDDLRVDVGPGLRYRTPIGPVRVDLGYQVTRIEGLLVNGEPEPRRWRIHFSIGQAF